MISVLIDTSNRNLSVALAKDGKLLASTEYDAWQKQSELLVAELDNLCKKNNINPKEIGEVIAAKGPGSYTGVRIAISVAKVLSFALNIPLYLVSSLYDMKDGDKPSICLMNARSKRSYIGVYEGEKVLIADTIWENEAVMKFVSEHPDYSLMGDVSYLGLEGKKSNLFENLLLSNQEKYRVSNVLEAKPVYLKNLA